MAKKHDKKKDTGVTQGLLPLPYEPITKVATRETIRQQFGSGTIKSGQTKYHVKHSSLKIRPGYNARMNIFDLPFTEYLRDVLKIEELAMQLWEGGYPPPPLQGNFSEDGLWFIIGEGHRRYYAIAYLLSLGHTKWPKTGQLIEMVEVELLPAEYTELDWAKLTIKSQDNLKLTPLEYGHKFLQLNKVFGMSHDQIAAEFHGQKSRQWVTNMIALAELPVVIQQRIQKGELTPTAALHLKMNIKDEEKLTNAVEEGLKDGGQIKVHEAIAMDGEDYSDWQARMNNLIGDCKGDPFLCAQAILKLSDIKHKAIKQFPEQSAAIHSAEIDAINKVYAIRDAQADGPEETDTVDEEEDGPVSPAPVIIDTHAADEAEEASHITDGKFREPVPKSQKDVLPDIDFSHEKEEGIMDLTEAIKMCDKVSTRLNNIPMPDQHKKDMQGLLEAVVKRCTNAKDILKKAADKR